jgi:hypothetical protein
MWGTETCLGHADSACCFLQLGVATTEAIQHGVRLNAGAQRHLIVSCLLSALQNRCHEMFYQSLFFAFYHAFESATALKYVCNEIIMQLNICPSHTGFLLTDELIKNMLTGMYPCICLSKPKYVVRLHVLSSIRKIFLSF